MSFALLGVIVFFAFTTQVTTGFGAMMIAVTLGALLYPLPQLLAWLVPLIVMMSTYILWRHHAHIHWPLLCRSILPGMFAGLLAGQLLFYTLGAAGGLKIALGLLVAGLALRELLRKPDKMTAAPMLPWALAGGVVHGLFATGGPLLVQGLNAQHLDKAVFRSTLTVVWLLMAAVLSLSYLAAGNITRSTLADTALLSVCLPLSLIAGEWLHQRINARRFQRAVQWLLLVSGLVLALRQ